MAPKLEVLSSQEIDGGRVVQGRISVDGQDFLAFLVQPGLETALWVLPEGEAAKTLDHFRAAFGALLDAVLCNGVTAPANQPLADEEFQTVQQAWRLGLQHGWATGRMEPVSGATGFDYLWHQVWPNQLNLEVPSV